MFYNKYRVSHKKCINFEEPPFWRQMIFFPALFCFELLMVSAYLSYSILADIRQKSEN